MKKNNRPGAGRIFRSGLYSTAILAAAVVLAVLVNLAVRAIPARYTEFDLSEGGLYTLGETSRQLAGSLGQDVTIYYLCETGSEDAIITGLLDQYAAAGGRIRWEQVDPALHPAFAAQYGAETASAGSLIVDAGERSAVLDAADFYVYAYTDASSYSIRFDGDRLTITTVYDGNLYLEKRAFDKAAALFYEVFGVLPVLHVKTALLK